MTLQQRRLQDTGPLNLPAQQSLAGGVFNLTSELARHLSETIAVFNEAMQCVSIIQTQHSPMEWLNRSLGDLFTPTNTVVAAFRQAQNGETVDVECQRVGAATWYALSFASLPNGMVIVSARDMTERKQRDDAVARSHQELTNILTAHSNAAREASEQLALKVKELERRSREIGLMSEMVSLLQACVDVKEAYPLLARYMAKLFPSSSGMIAIIRESRNVAEVEVSWGVGSEINVPVFAPNECWGLRSGRAHNSTEMPICSHLSGSTDLGEGCWCIPMAASGETLGVVNVRLSAKLDDAQRQLLTAVTEQIALALANLKLRKALNELSIRDPLTGLFNRRYMEESIGRELARANRSGERVAFLMIDTDFFKKFNDTYGHEVGDAVLRELGAMFKTHLREHDIPCRYAGDEWLMILVGKEISPESALRRAEELRMMATRIRVQAGGQLVGQITLSIGVAVFPDHGEDQDGLLRASDRALYQAKDAGRNQVALAVTEQVALMEAAEKRLELAATDGASDETVGG
jgi:diguanylate cyclase (GGDEF)-like protein